MSCCSLTVMTAAVLRTGAPVQTRQIYLQPGIKSRWHDDWIWIRFIQLLWHTFLQQFPLYMLYKQQSLRCAETSKQRSADAQTDGLYYRLEYNIKRPNTTSEKRHIGRQLLDITRLEYEHVIVCLTWEHCWACSFGWKHLCLERCSADRSWAQLHFNSCGNLLCCFYINYRAVRCLFKTV